MNRWKSLHHRLELHRLLSGGKTVVASQLAKEWECNERTVRRALTCMRDEYNLPLEYDPVNATWRYTGQVDEIPAVLVSHEDRRALLFSLQAAAQFEGTPVTGQIRRLYQALLDTLPPEQLTGFQRMMENVRFTGPLISPIKKEVWDVLLLCLEARETMSITYTDATYGHTSHRDVDPYGLIMRDRRWLLVAYWVIPASSTHGSTFVSPSVFFGRNRNNRLPNQLTRRGDQPLPRVSAILEMKTSASKDMVSSHV